MNAAGYGALATSVAAYAVGIVAQSVAAQRAERRETVDPGLLLRLARDRVYLLGVCAQLTGFAMAFFARASLPLYLVQAGASSAVGLAALIGAVFLGWRIRTAEIVVLAVLAGVGFAVVAIASRPIASGPLADVPMHPLAWVMVGAALVGQALFAAALQRGSATATTASMDAATVLIASFAGLILLGDQLADGLSWLAALGLVLVVAGVLAMARVSGPRPGPDERQPEPAVERVN